MSENSFEHHKHKHDNPEEINEPLDKDCEEKESEAGIVRPLDDGGEPKPGTGGGGTH